MASTCPNCGRKLHWYDVKAECKECGVSIPNFNWEARLEEDNVKAEKQFQSFYKTLNIFAYSIWGTKHIIARIILSFLPAVGFILPWAYLKSDAQSIGIDMIGIFTDGKSLIDVLKSFFGNAGLYISNMSYEGFSGPLTYVMLSVLFMLLSALLIVIAFFLILFTFKKPKTKAMFVFDILSILSAVVSAVLFTVGMSAADAKSDEQLEEERLAKKAAKEEKARQDAIKKEKAREESERKAAEENAALVEKARAKLNADKNKKKKE